MRTACLTTKKEPQEKTTAPLREMLVKGTVYSWNKKREEAFQTLMHMMSSEATHNVYE